LAIGQLVMEDSRYGRTYVAQVKTFIDLQVVIFFFQAEDGIRDGHVTGVQTCALPILKMLVTGSSGLIGSEVCTYFDRIGWEIHRSEERRVGKECRSPRWADN